MHMCAETLEFVSSTFFFIPYYENNDTLRKERELSLLPSFIVLVRHVDGMFLFNQFPDAKSIFVCSRLRVN